MPKICPVCETVYPDANAFCPVDGTTLHVVDLDGGLIGSVVADRYLVTDLLGEGGMGKVYKARHVRLPQQAAIKVLRRDMVRDPAAIARFNREASNASRIDDEHVARVFDFGETDGGTVYLAMEFVAGRTLRDIITKGGPVEPTRAAELVRQIARGLDAAHRLKIIHRDLKPDNILVIEGEDGHDRVKVVDFGIAKAFGAEEGQLTRTGFIVGTPEFMSPEQLLGEQLDARSDVYALALVAFQCLTAALPFGGDTPEQAMTGRLTRAPKRLDEVSTRAWPEGLQGVFDAALSREVAGRPASAGEFARRLGEAIGGATAVAATKGATATSGASAVASSTRRETPTPTVATAEGKRRSLVGPALAAVVVLGIAGGLVYFLRASDDPRYSELPADEAMARATPPGMVAPDSTPAPRSASDSASRRVSDSARTVASAPVAPPAGAPAPANPAPPKGASASGATRDSVVAKAPQSEGGEPAPPRTSADDGLRARLDSLSTAVAMRGVDAAAARRLASELRELAPRFGDPSLKARAYFRLIDASALGGDLDGACAALRGAKANARGAQLADVRRYEGQLGCS